MPEARLERTRKAYEFVLMANESVTITLPAPSADDIEKLHRMIGEWKRGKIDTDA